MIIAGKTNECMGMVSSYFLVLRSSNLYDARNHQRKVEFPQETTIKTFEYNDNQLLKILWKDGHVSQYDLNELFETFTKKILMTATG